MKKTDKLKIQLGKLPALSELRRQTPEEAYKSSSFGRSVNAIERSRRHLVKPLSVKNGMKEIKYKDGTSEFETKGSMLYQRKNKYPIRKI